MFCKVTLPLSAKLDTPDTILLSLFLDDDKSDWKCHCNYFLGI